MIRRFLILAIVFGGCAQKEEPLVRIDAIPVQIEVARPAPFTPTITLFGTVRPNQTTPVTTTVGGTITYPTRFAGGLRGGEEVRRGEPLAMIENEASRLALAQAKLQRESARTDFERAEASFKAGIASKAELSSAELRLRLASEALASASKTASRSTLTSPASGRLVVQTIYPPRSEIAAGTSIASIASGGRPFIEAAAAASDRALLRPGQSVRIRSGGRDVGRGVVREIAPIIDDSGTARVICDAAGEADLPAPGEGVELLVELGAFPEAFTVPEEAIVIDSNGAAIFVVERPQSGDVRRKHIVKRIDVQLGGRSAGRVEIKNGLEQGKRVVVSSVDALSDGVAVSIPEEKV